MTRLHFGVNFGIERSIGWVWAIRANAGCHEHRRSKFALMNIQISKCDPYREKFLLTERVIGGFSVAVTKIVFCARGEGHASASCRRNLTGGAPSFAEI